MARRPWKMPVREPGDCREFTGRMGAVFASLDSVPIANPYLRSGSGRAPEPLRPEDLQEHRACQAARVARLERRAVAALSPTNRAYPGQPLAPAGPRFTTRTR